MDALDPNENPEGYILHLEDLLRDRQRTIRELEAKADNLPDKTPEQPTWISVEQMPSMPKGWYWAEYPGQWVWYSPKWHQEQGIFHGTTSWTDATSKRYWGPWVEPPQSETST